MRRLTLRLSDELADALRRAAAARGQSVNAIATSALQALVDPEYARTEVEGARARLAAAGLAPEAMGRRTPRPDPDVLERARRSVKPGKPFSDYVSEDRGA